MGEAMRDAAVEIASNDILAEDLDPDFILDEIARAFNYNRASAFVRMYSEDSEDFTNKVKALGFDGIVVNDEYVVFEPTQIKEVRNTGLFGKQESLIFQARQPVYNEGFLGDYNNEVEDGDELPEPDVVSVQDIALNVDFMLVDTSAHWLYLANRDGQLIFYNISDPEVIERVDQLMLVEPGRQLTQLVMLLLQQGMKLRLLILDNLYQVEIM